MYHLNCLIKYNKRLKDFNDIFLLHSQDEKVPLLFSLKARKTTWQREISMRNRSHRVPIYKIA